MQNSHLQLLRDESDIRAVILRFAVSLDMQDWAQCRSCFADKVYTDHSDLREDSPSVISADEFVALRRAALSGLKTQHVSTNHLITVNGNEASCVSGMVIYRRRFIERRQATFDTHCYYSHTLVRTQQGWKISRVKQTVLWNTGDPAIYAGMRGDEN